MLPKTIHISGTELSDWLLEKSDNFDAEFWADLEHDTLDVFQGDIQAFIDHYHLQDQVTVEQLFEYLCKRI